MGLAQSSDFRSVLRTMGVGLGAGLFLGFAGPFGTFQSMPTGQRVLYWVAMIMGGTLVVPVVSVLARSWLRPRGVSPALYLPVVAAIGSVPAAMMVVAITFIMLGIARPFDLDLYILVLTITLPLVIIQHLLIDARERTAARGRDAASTRAVPSEPVAVSAQPAPQSSPAELPAAVSPPPKPRPRLLDRLPPRLGDDILCLQMEDHYVRVHTALGQEMILLRMRDAIAELDGLDGSQVHRSWWVARRAVTGHERDGKTLTLKLTNGLAAPVARDRQAEVRAAGWLT